MKRLMIVALTIAIILTMLASAMRSIGAAMPPSQATVDLLGIADCAPPCWHGIMPGKTTIDEALTILKGDGKFIESLGLGDNALRLCWALIGYPAWSGCASRDREFDNTVKRINLRSFQGTDMTLGDALTLLGTPKAIWPCVIGNRARIGIYFDNNVELWAFDDRVIGQAKITPDLPVRQIIVHFPGEDLPYAFDLPHWRGFHTFPLQMTCPTMP